VTVRDASGFQPDAGAEAALSAPGQQSSWNGNPMALAELIHRMVEQGVASGVIEDIPLELRPG
jgi:hypothetical protein